MGEAVTSTSVESTKAALEESRELAKVISNENKWFDESVKSIEIKEAYKKVQVQITEEYQLVEDDPTTLGIDVQRSEHGEVAVIVKGKVLDDEEVALLQMKKTHTEIGGITTESTEVHMSKPLDAAIEAPPQPPPPKAIEPPANPPDEEKKEPEKEEKAPPIEPPPPAPQAPAEEKASEGELKNLNLENTQPSQPLPKLSLKGDYQPEEKTPEEIAYELLIGKISWVPPPEKPINKCYFYKPKEGEKKSTKWPPKSNVSTIIVKPRVRRADEVDRPRGTTPKPPGLPKSQQKMTEAPKSTPEATQQISTEQVSGSLPQEVPKSENVPTSGSNETKPIEGESQISESSEPAPPSSGEVVEPPKEGEAVQAPTQETPGSQETPVPQETPASQETPAAQENSAPQETPAQQETSAPQETPATQETPTEQSADSAPPPTA